LKFIGDSWGCWGSATHDELEAGYERVTWPNRYLIGTMAAIALVLSALVAGLHSGGKGTGVLNASTKSPLVAEASSATSSLSPGISSEQAALSQLEQRLGAAADQAEAQRLQQTAAWLRAASARPSSPRPASGPSVAAPSADAGPGQRALAAAEAELGKPYRYAGAGPNSFDCSGLTMWSWRAAGVSLPHSATDQYSSTPHVALSSLQPGDLLYFGSSTSNIGHVTMYVSPGRMIEAEDSGTVVSINPIRSGLVGASRP
jgi:cell wall-associated NlpC family hydrolase